MTVGLRRFLTTAPAPGAGSATAAEPAFERCEMCDEATGEQHGHVVDLKSRNILCACRACYLLFTRTGAGAQRFRAIPERYLYTPDFSIHTSTWESIGIPVRMAFFFTNSDIGDPVAFYPSPAGATECLLPLDQWRSVVEQNPDFADCTVDTEALLINKADDRFECFLVPIDQCYRLVGIVKLRWRGFDGGTEAWEAIECFFAGLRERATLIGGTDG